MKSRLRSRSHRATFFSRYSLQFLYDAVAIIAEELGIYLPWETTHIRELTYLTNLAEANRKRRSTNQTGNVMHQR